MAIGGLGIGVSTAAVGASVEEPDEVVACAKQVSETVGRVNVRAYLPHAGHAPVLLHTTQDIPPRGRLSWDGTKVIYRSIQGEIDRTLVDHVNITLLIGTSQRSFVNFEHLELVLREISPNRSMALRDVRVTGSMRMILPARIECIDTVEAGRLYYLTDPKGADISGPSLMDYLWQGALRTPQGELLGF